MSGIYIHIPFCKQACYYCDFHFSTSKKNRTEIVNTLIKEIQIRQDYLVNKEIQSIYFGGGTPSLLSVNEIYLILNEIYKHFKLSKNCEITLEANPDDLNKKKLHELLNLGINRLSVGIQSFFDEDLKFLNRAHLASDALNSIKTAQQSGFKNITVDLIYGFSQLTIKKWMHNIQTVLDLNIPHISAYSLTIEKGTAFHHFIKNGQLLPLNDDVSVEHFNLLQNELGNAGFEHYEISNFAKPGFYAVHNLSYWQQKNYLGIGPSAHSFNGKSRQWNISNNALYIKNIYENKLFHEMEELSESTLFNEFILTSLRTKWGLEKKIMNENFNQFLSLFNKQKDYLVQQNLLLENDTHICVSEKGKLFTDKITSNFFIL